MSDIHFVHMVTLVCLVLLAAAGAWADGDTKTRVETATSSRHEYAVEMGGTMDGENTRTPIGYGVWSQAFEPNISLRMENVGEVDVVNPWILVNGKRNWRTVEDVVAEAISGRKTEKEKAVGELRGESAKLAVEIAEKLIAAEVDAKKHKKLIDDMVGKV